MKRCPTCATSFVRGGKFCPEDGSQLVDTLDAKLESHGNTDDLATIPIGMSDAAAGTAFSSTSGLLAGDDALVGQVVADRYQIQEVVGRGGMGVVYRARHLLLDREVAVKLLRPQYVTDERAVARFLREARAMARIEHENAVHVYDFGVLPGGAYLVMEFVEGDSLRMFLMQSAPLALVEAVMIAEQVCAAVQAAHDQGVLHRDLKPENIMLRDEEEAVVVKVVDFGLAKIVSGDDDNQKSITSTNELFGTPCYMAPEFFEGNDIDTRSDVYAIGIVLYEMLAGAPPFRGTMQTVIGAHLFKEAPPITTTNGDVPPSIDALLRQTLRKDRSERPASAAEFASRLRRAYTAFLAGEEVAEPLGGPGDEPETELRLDNMPTLAPLPDRLRREAAAGASADSEPAPPAVVESVESGKLPPTEPVPLAEMATSPSGRRSHLLRAGVAVGSVAVLVLAFLSFDASSGVESETTTPPAATAPPAAEPSVEASEVEPLDDGRFAPVDADETNGADAAVAPAPKENSGARSASARASDTAVGAADAKARTDAQPDQSKAKQKPAAQPAKDDKKARKRAWYDPRRWFGKN
jgi:eukaryotic-like serine/threonine-protein kinase